MERGLPGAMCPGGKPEMGRQRAGPGPFPGRRQDTTRNPKAAPGREHRPQRAPAWGIQSHSPASFPGPGQAHQEGPVDQWGEEPQPEAAAPSLRGCLRLLFPFTSLIIRWTSPRVAAVRPRGGHCHTLETPNPAPAWSAALLSPPTELHVSGLTGGVAPGLPAEGCPGGQEARAPALHPVARPV